MLRSRTHVLLVGAALLFSLSSCAEEQSANLIAADTAAVDTAAADSIAAQPDTLTVARTDTVRVVLSEFNIKMPTSLRPGPTAFRVRNAGDRAHGFKLEHGDREEELGGNLQSGTTRTLSVRLRPGTYEVYCPVKDHAGQGMEVTLTVEGDNASE